MDLLRLSNKSVILFPSSYSRLELMLLIDTMNLMESRGSCAEEAARRKLQGAREAGSARSG